MTECNQLELLAQAPGGREIVARFNGGDITSDAGVLLLGAVEERRGILERFATCFDDYRDLNRAEHSCKDIVSQRVLAIALGYEDVNDHERLKLDPLLASVVGKADPKGANRKRSRDKGVGLAAPSTINRLELSHPGLAGDARYHKIALDQDRADDLFIDVFLEAYDEAPEEIFLDLDATDDRVHGNQIGRHYNGYYDAYCFLPLYIFSGDHLLCARLRTADRDAADGSIEELDRIILRLRAAWPETRIIVRADSGFCRDEIMSYCEAEGYVEYVLGLAGNARLRPMVAEEMDAMDTLCKASGGKPHRTFKDLEYRTLDSWAKSRRVVAKAEALSGKGNSRFVVTSLSAKEQGAKELYEDVYCARGEMENRIKEQQLDLFADRTSCTVFRGNQVRLYLSSIAYVLMSELRRLGLADTELERAQCGTIRTKLLKIGAQVRITFRKVWVSMSESYPYQELLARIWARLRPA